METGHQEILDLTTTWFGILSIIVFVVAYALVISEEFLHLRKSKAVMVAAGVIWALVAAAYALHGDTVTAAAAVRHNLLEYAELLLFLLAAMTYVNTLEERNVFNALRAWLVSSGYSLPSIFWITGLLLVVYGLFSDPAIYARSLGYNVNLYWGAILAVFGGVMLLLARLGARRGKTSARAAAGSGSPPKASSG